MDSRLPSYLQKQSEPLVDGLMCSMLVPNSNVAENQLFITLHHPRLLLCYGQFEQLGEQTDNYCRHMPQVYISLHPTNRKGKTVIERRKGLGNGVRLESAFR
jgi:hypothetical protein